LPRADVLARPVDQGLPTVDGRMAAKGRAVDGAWMDPDAVLTGRSLDSIPSTRTSPNSPTWLGDVHSRLELSTETGRLSTELAASDG
jgi:hypothetical protein